MVKNSRKCVPVKTDDLVDLRTYNLEDLDCQFDSIVIDAPLEEYKTTALRFSNNLQSRVAPLAKKC